MYQDLVPSVRETVGVSDAYDASSVLPAIRRAAVFLLRTYTFPKALTLHTSAQLPVNTKDIALPAANVGIVQRVRLFLDGATPLFKTLRKGETGALPRSDGPVTYSLQGNTVVLDTALAAAGYQIQVWYHSTDTAAHEPWLSTEFEDVLFTRGVITAALGLHKPEVAATYTGIWQEMVPSLATYLSEVENNDLDVRMAPQAAAAVPRYPTGATGG